MACDCEQTALLRDHREQTVVPFDEEPDTAEKPTAPARKKRKFKSCAGRFLQRQIVRTLMAICLIIALFGGGIVVLMDLPDEPTNAVLDVTMCVVAAIFVAEIILRCIAEGWSYVFSFFCCTDVIGTLSMLFEISFLLGDAGKVAAQGENGNTVLVRTARAARLGARAGRLSRSLRCMSFISAPYKKVDPADEGYKAKILGKRLVNTFSSKISMLIIAIVVGIPLFDLGEYPTDDFSMSAWTYKLELDYEHDVQDLSDGKDVGAFERSVQEMVTFYERLSYPPYAMEGFPSTLTVDGKSMHVPGADHLEGEGPKRLQNVVVEKVSSCTVPRDGCEGDTEAAVLFNFTHPNRYTALMDMAVIIFIIGAMVLATLDMTHCIDILMIAPMEQMLSSAHSMAQQVSQALRGGKAVTKDQGLLLAPGTDVDDDDYDEEFVDEDNADEMEELEELFKKVVFIIGVFMEENTVSAPQMEFLDQPTKGVMQEVVGAQPSMNIEVVKSNRQSEVQRQGTRQSMKIFQSITKTPSTAQNGDLPVPVDQVDTWSLDFFPLTAAQQIKVVTHIVFHTDLAKISASQWGEAAIFEVFAQKVHDNYNNDLPYTNFTHACDTLASCYRLLGLSSWAMWMSDLDCYALLIASLAHDVGHLGRTNQFLVETSHELALRYNDTSPLEQMHCSKLFDILRENEDANVFIGLTAKEFKQARAVCIEAILHTDYTHHFKMVKEMKQLYGVNVELLQKQAKSPDDFDQAYTQLLQDNSRLLTKLILHLADIGNPVQQFHVSQKWASKVMDELFQQGDEEKKLGIPVGMLNDRDKISIPRAQMSFIGVLLSPLVLSTLRILPVMYPISRQMASNLEAWHNLWIEATNPAQEEVMKRRDSLRRIQDQLVELGKSLPQLVKKTSLVSAAPKVAATASSAAVFQGRWTCTGTWGLNEFLTACKFSLLRRKAAMSAPWPTWEFQQSGDHFVFVNMTAVGELREEFTVNGPPYSTVDGWKQTVNCKASWDSKSPSKLIIERNGPQGKFREERFVDDQGKLQFVLQSYAPEAKWGRTFEKKS